MTAAETGAASATRNGATAESVTPATMTARPSPAASVLAVAAGTGTMALLGVDLVPTLAITIGGLVLVACGLALYRRGWAMVGAAVGAVGAAVCALAVGIAASQAPGTSVLLQVVPGVLGLALLGFALVPVRGSGVRWLVKAGAGGVFLAVALGGLFRLQPFSTLLLGMAGAVVAWDAGEHAIDVGRQLGRAATTWRLDVTHVGATAAVGGVGVAAGHAVAGVGTGVTSPAAFALLVVALVALAVALHR